MAESKGEKKQITSERNKRYARYRQEYAKANLRQYLFRVSYNHPDDVKVIEWLKTIPNVNDYIRQLILSDITYHKRKDYRERKEAEKLDSSKLSSSKLTSSKKTVAKKTATKSTGTKSTSAKSTGKKSVSKAKSAKSTKSTSKKKTK